MPPPSRACGCGMSCGGRPAARSHCGRWRCLRLAAAGKKATDCGVTTSTPSSIPYEAGIGFAVRMRRGDFLGRDEAEENSRTGLTRKLCCMTLNDPNRRRHGQGADPERRPRAGLRDERNYGHSIGLGIAYGYLPMNYAEVGPALTSSTLASVCKQRLRRSLCTTRQARR